MGEKQRHQVGGLRDVFDAARLRTIGQQRNAPGLGHKTLVGRLQLHGQQVDGVDVKAVVGPNQLHQALYC